jgi:fatty-acyl-CoA synthase
MERIGEDGPDGLDVFLAAAPETPPAIVIDDSDPVAMTFTGGTTRRPKGAVARPRSRNLSSWATALEHEMTAGNTARVLTLLYHAMGLLMWLNAAVLAGATSVIFRIWDPDEFADACAQQGVSNAIMVPLQLQALLSPPHYDPHKLQSL